MLFVSLDSLMYTPFDLEGVYGLELRIDLLPTLDINKIAQFLDNAPLPVLFTVRHPSHGGEFLGTEPSRIALIRRLLQLKPTFFDLEYDMDDRCLIEIMNHNPNVHFIISYHACNQSIDHLQSVYQQMQSIPAFHYKIAYQASSSCDALRGFILSKQHSNLTVIPMGPYGSFVRALSVTNPHTLLYTYHPHQTPIASGQLSLQDYKTIYQYPYTSSQAELYALLGDPVEHSLGHVYHNQRFLEQQKEAIYVKIPLQEKDLSTFFPLAKEAGFRGFSVTTPLKEAVLPYIDEVDSYTDAIGAVNTLLLSHERWLGKNVDGIGALDAIEEVLTIQNKKCLIIGCGGAAKAIAFEAKQRGAIVHIANRSLEKAQHIAHRLYCSCGPLTALPQYDILVNCSAHPMPIESHQLQTNTVVMDISYKPGQEMPLLAEAKKLGCITIPGENMFFQQAKQQALLWKVASLISAEG